MAVYAVDPNDKHFAPVKELINDAVKPSINMRDKGRAALGQLGIAALSWLEDGGQLVDRIAVSHTTKPWLMYQLGREFYRILMAHFPDGGPIFDEVWTHLVRMARGYGVDINAPSVIEAA